MKNYVQFILRYHLVIIFIWLALAIAAIPFALEANTYFKIGSVTDPNVESSIAEQRMIEQLPYGGSRIYILYKSKSLKVNHAKFKNEVQKSLDGLKDFSLKFRLMTPYENSRQIAEDEHSAYALVVLKQKAEDLSNWVPEFKEKLGKPKSLQMIVGGDPSYVSDIQELSRKDLFRAEVIAVPLSILTLIFIFGAIVAGLLPTISGFLSVTIIIGTMYWVGHVTELSIFVLNIATMLGLGLSLDYTLLVVSRFREELAQGHEAKEAINITLHTAGKSVFFSGMTVLISISALLFFPVNILYSIGIGGVVVVFIAILSALLFLPSLLYLLKSYVNAGTLRKRTLSDLKHGFWFKLSMGIMKHPLLVFIPTILFLFLLGYPFIHVKVNRPDPKILPTWAESRQLVDLFHANFNENELTPIFVLAESKSKSILKPQNISRLYDFVEQLKNDKNVEHVNSIVSVEKNLSKKQYQQLYQLPVAALNPNIRNFLKQSTKGNNTIISVISKYSVNDSHTFDLVEKIRDTRIKNISFQVGGFTAVIIDTIKSVYDRFYKLIIAIAIVTYLVLLVLLRSLFLPLKAIIMNFSSLIVSYGMLVFIFQEGHFANLLNFKAQGFTDLNLPIILFCGLFGLSMDYEVFLLTRIKEYYDKTGDNTLSVALGLQKSAGVITSAALIIVMVAVAFVTADVLFVKAFGLGLALAIAVDATIIRILLVPATMRLMGKWNWYLPKWLDRILPKIHLGI